MVEVMVGFLMLLVLAGGFFYWYFLGDEQRRLSRAITSMDEKQQTAFLQVKKAVNGAIRNSGFSQQAFPGIRNVPSVLPGRENLILFRQKYPEVTAKMTATVINPSPRKLVFDISNTPLPSGGCAAGSTDIACQAREAERILRGFITQAPAGTRHFAFILGDYTNILPVSFNSGTSLFEADLSDASFSGVGDGRINDEINSEAYVTMAEQLRIEVNAEGEWVMVESFSNPASPRTTMILPAIEGLSYLFEFSDHMRPRGAAALRMVIPNRPLTTWNGSDYIQTGCTYPSSPPGQCCDPAGGMTCVDSSDLATLRIQSEISSDYGGRKEILLNQAHLSFSNGKLFKQSLFAMVPENYSLAASDSGATAQDARCLDPANRCKPGCENFFNVTSDRTSPRWVGYGMYMGNPSGQVSAYCSCGTSNPADPGTFVPPDTQAGRDAIPAFQAPLGTGSGAGFVVNPANRQINACVSHFGNVYDFAWKHSAMFFWWNGLWGSPNNFYRQDNDDPSLGTPGTIDRFTWHWGRFEEFRAAYMSSLATDASGNPSAWSSHLVCRLSRDYLSSSFRQIFYSASGGDPSLVTISDPPVPANRPRLGPFVSGSSGPTWAAPVEEKCLCRTIEPIFHKEVCNHNLPPTQVVCSNTWYSVPDGAGNPVGQYVSGTAGLTGEGLRKKIYRVNGTGITDGFQDPRQAARCECLNQTYNPPYRNSSDLPYMEGHAASNAWDFRVDPTSSQYTSSLSPVGTFTDVQLSTPGLLYNPTSPYVQPTAATFENVYKNADGSSQRPHFSPYVRRVKVHYINDNSPSPTVQLSDWYRCDDTWQGYIGKCTKPFALPAEQDEHDDIIAFLTTANPALTADQKEAYAGYCRRQCFDEQLYGAGVGSWYDRTGIRWVRANLVNTPSNPNNLPIECGGRITNWVPSP